MKKIIVLLILYCVSSQSCHSPKHENINVDWTQNFLCNGDFEQALDHQTVPCWQGTSIIEIGHGSNYVRTKMTRVMELDHS